MQRGLAGKIVSNSEPGVTFLLLICAIVFWHSGAAALDQSVQQVQLEVRFAEVSRNVAKQLGIDPLADAIEAYRIDPSQATSVGGTIDQSVQTSAGGEALIFGALSDVVVPGTVPAVTYPDVGVQLRIVPTVTDNSRLRFSIDANSGVPDPVLGAPGVSRRSVNTTVEVRDGQSFAIAGLVRDDDGRPETDIPLLSGVPILASLFRSDEYRRSQTELVVFVTPGLVGPGGSRSSGSGGTSTTSGTTSTTSGTTSAGSRSPVSASFAAGFGEMNRGGIQLPVRIELGGQFLDPIDIKPGWSRTFNASGRIDFNLGGLGYDEAFLASKRLGMNFSYVRSDASGSINIIEGGNINPSLDGSALLDPAGLYGNLGGGGIKLTDGGVGFADHTDVRARSKYEAFTAGLDISNAYDFGMLRLRPIGGLFYRYTDEDIDISGTTGNQYVDYTYRNGLNSDRLGVEFSVLGQYEISRKLRFSFTPRAAFSQVWADGKSAVNVDAGGAPFASSSASGLDGTFTSFDYSASAAIEYEFVNGVSMSLTGSWGSGEDPALEFEPEQQGKINGQRYDYWNAVAGIRVDF